MTFLDRAAVVARRESHNRGIAEADLWTLCALASRTVGQYKRGDTAKISAAFGTSIDTVERMAAGYAIFDALRRVDHRRAWAIRKEHTYRRFLAVGVNWTRWEFEPEQAFTFLESDLKPTAIDAQCLDMYDVTPMWKRRFYGTSAAVLKLVTDDAPEEIKEWAQAGADLFKKYSDNK